MLGGEGRGAENILTVHVGKLRPQVLRLLQDHQHPHIPVIPRFLRGQTALPVVGDSQELTLTVCLFCALLLQLPDLCSLFLEHLPCCCSSSGKPSLTPPARPEASLTLFIVWKSDLPVRDSWRQGPSLAQGLPKVTTALWNVQGNLAVCLPYCLLWPEPISGAHPPLSPFALTSPHSCKLLSPER